ncbi:TnsA-like heteromeric transposase endonuclease subunit [Amycolatopsis sp. QT-25]|uniref:TnsA-like heteromeric transposase endonuclease subunit n=1 Tax=Amycolatopsis sp. QT-25 TaxID=3034022 RepID=UPI0023EBF73C|nr:TnsA-like heteromeric transposase endonuclease subunit [Amycolatopsis sp. QT-25]WET81102.1 TnsA-like heteromeric transposase endonuclease subunit [Amycolatopsis sp. QT-25]
MAAASISASTTVSYRCADTAAEEVQVWASVEPDVLRSAVPWRTFRWYKGQKHYSGTFWSATERDLVIYESRLELARLLFADFDTSVGRIVPQPFLLRAVVAGALRRHIPDYLLFTTSGPLVVDVKLRHRVDRPDNAFTFAWTRQVVESRGWRYEVWSEPPAVELQNVRFLAGYRRDWLFDHGLLAELRAADLDGATLEVTFRSFPKQPTAVVRCADVSRVHPHRAARRGQVPRTAHRSVGKKGKPGGRGSGLKFATTRSHGAGADRLPGRPQQSESSRGKAFRPGQATRTHSEYPSR